MFISSSIRETNNVNFFIDPLQSVNAISLNEIKSGRNCKNKKFFRESNCISATMKCDCVTMITPSASTTSGLVTINLELYVPNAQRIL